MPARHLSADPFGSVTLESLHSRHKISLVRDRRMSCDRFEVDDRLREFGEIWSRASQARDIRKCLLHRFSRVQNISVAAEAARHLQTEGHAVLVDATRQRDYGVCDERDEISQRKPLVVIAQPPPFERFEVKLGPGEWRDRHSWRQHKVIVSKSDLEAPENSCLFSMRPGHVGKRHARADFVIRPHVSAEQTRVFFVDIAVTIDIALCADDIEAAVGLARSRN